MCGGSAAARRRPSLPPRPAPREGCGLSPAPALARRCRPLPPQKLGPAAGGGSAMPGGGAAAAAAAAR